MADKVYIVLRRYHWGWSPIHAFEDEEEAMTFAESFGEDAERRARGRVDPLPFNARGEEVNGW